MVTIYWIKHGGNKEKSHFSGRVSTIKHRKKCVGDACHIRGFFLEFGASALATMRKGRTSCRDMGRRPECTRRRPAKNI